MSPIARWLRTTFDYNPAFPLSALALLVGLRLLASEGAAQSPLEEALFAGGILQAYEALLLGVALVVLWPRAIAYETTAILIILAVVRFAAPFLAARLAGEGQLGLGLALGAGTWVLGTLKVEAAARSLDLDWSGRERAWDSTLFFAGCVALPLLAHQLATRTGLDLSHQSARLVQLASWWGLALLLAPLALGRETLGRQEGDLSSRAPALTWRGLTFAGLALLATNALWIGGGLPSPLALAPLVLVGVAIALHVLRSCGLPLTPWVAHLPALALGAGALGARSLALGSGLTRAHALALLALPCALAIPLLVRDGASRIAAARSLGVVAALAPLAVLPRTWTAPYLLTLTGAGLVQALVVASDLRAALAAAGVVGITLYLGAGAPTLAAFGALLALAVAWRLHEARRAATIAYLLCYALPLGGSLLEVPRAPALLAFCLAPLAGLVLARRQERSALVGAGVAVLATVVGRRATVGARPAYILLAGAFGAIPFGTWYAIRREARAREQDAALLADERFEEPRVEPLVEVA